MSNNHESGRLGVFEMFARFSPGLENNLDVSKLHVWRYFGTWEVNIFSKQNVLWVLET